MESRSRPNVGNQKKKEKKMKNTPYAKFIGFISSRSLKAMADGGVGHSNLGKFVDVVKKEEKSRVVEEEEAPKTVRKFKGTPPPDTKGVKRKGTTGTKRKGKVSTPKPTPTTGGKRRGRPKKGK